MQATGMTLWLTGLSGAGKSTLSQAIAAHPMLEGRSISLLDGDVLRKGLCSDLGFSAEDRHENIRRVAEVARLMNDAGLLVCCALISPLRADRAMARTIIGHECFLEVHVAASLEACEARDPKGLYKRARAGLIPMFTGIDSSYEVPEAADLVLDTGRLSVAESVQQLAALLRDRMAAPLRPSGSAPAV